MTHDPIPHTGALFPDLRTALVVAARQAGTPTPKAKSSQWRPSKTGALVIAGLAIGAGAGGLAVADSVNQGTETPPAVEAPAPNPNRADARHDPISALTLDAYEQAGGFSVPAGQIAAMRDAFAPGAEASAIPKDRVLLANGHLQVVAFWGKRQLCLRVRPTDGGGNSMCATWATANDPATPMYTAPEAGQAGPVVMLVPDSVSKIVVQSKDGLAKVVPIRGNLAVADVTGFSSITWVTNTGRAYRR